MTLNSVFCVPRTYRVRNLLCLNLRVQFLLPILQTHRHIGRAFRAPEKVEVIAEALALVQPVTAPKSR